MPKKINLTPVERLYVDGKRFYRVYSEKEGSRCRTITVRSGKTIIKNYGPEFLDDMTFDKESWAEFHGMDLPQIRVDDIKPLRKLLLLDGQNILYRSFFALPNLTHAGKPTGALKGFVNQLYKVKKLFKDAHPILVFDGGGKTERHSEYPDYKKGRGKTDDALLAQIGPAKDMATAMGFPVFCQEGVEADDIIGTVSRTHTRKVIIYSSDKDFGQLVNSRVSLYNLSKSTLLDENGVFGQYGVHPDQICDWLMLLGDKSDNIPGVPGIGPKTACKLLSSYGSVSDIVKNKSKLSDKMRLSIESTDFGLSRSMVELRHIDMSTDLSFRQEDPDFSDFLASYGIQRPAWR